MLCIGKTAWRSPSSLQFTIFFTVKNDSQPNQPNQPNPTREFQQGHSGCKPQASEHPMSPSSRKVFGSSMKTINLALQTIQPVCYSRNIDVTPGMCATDSNSVEQTGLYKSTLSFHQHASANSNGSKDLLSASRLKSAHFKDTSEQRNNRNNPSESWNGEDLKRPSSMRSLFSTSRFT